MPLDEPAIADLATGTPRQRAAHAALEGLRLLELLAPFDPVVAGTIPIDVDLEESDLDVVCEVHDLDAFAHRLEQALGALPGFGTSRAVLDGLPSVVARFQAGALPVEVVGQARPARKQLAYRHMLVEARLLALGGKPARERVRVLKRAGLKTEPAFARVFGIAGDPYLALAALADLSLEQLCQQVASWD